MDGKLGEKRQALATGMAGELATVFSALLGSNAAAVASTSQVTPGWVVTCGLSGALTGSITLAVSEADASTLARRLMGMDEEPPEDAVADTLGEVAGQAAGGLGQQPVAGGAKIRVEGAPTRGQASPSGTPSVFDVVMEDGTSLRFACWAQVDAPADVTASSSSAAAEAPSGAAPVGDPDARAVASAPENLDVILDIELPLTVRFGRTEMTLHALSRIGPGSVIDLDRSPDEPVEVLINDKVIARGEVVVVAGNYGVRILDVLSQTDRIRTLGT